MSAKNAAREQRDAFEPILQFSRYMWAVRSTGRVCSASKCDLPVAFMRINGAQLRGWCSVHVPDYALPSQCSTFAPDEILLEPTGENIETASGRLYGYREVAS